MANEEEQSAAVEETQLPLEGPGDRLRIAREKAKLTIEQVAAETRVPQRQLEFIEAGQFDDLPGRTYAIGFSRSFAKAVGLDDNQIAEEVREHLGSRDYHAQVAEDGFEPGDPARVPSRGLAWFGLFAAVLLIAGLFVFYNRIFAPGSGPASILSGDDAEMVAETDVVENTPAAPPQVNAAAPVTFTATRDGVWVRFYDATYADSRQPLMEKQMALGETYTVPATADNPQIRTGWPAALDVSVDGRKIGQLSREDEVLSDIDITGPALVARINAQSEAAEQESEGAT